MPVTVSLLTGTRTAPVVTLIFLARMHTPVTPKALVHSVCGFIAGGLSTVPFSELPTPRRVIPSVRICTAWW